MPFSAARGGRVCGVFKPVMKIAIVFERVYEHTMGGYFERALRSLGAQVDHFWAHSARAIPPQYDLYLRVDDSFLEHRIPEKLQPQILFASDLHIPHVFSKVIKQRNQYRMVLTPVRPAVKKLKQLGVPVDWFNIGCEPETHFPVPGPKLYDIGFVGNDGGSPRKFILEALLERYPRSFFGHADFRELGRIYSASRIGFNYAIRDEYFQMRSYEILASRTMLLMHALGDDTLERLGFAEGRDLVTFKSVDELFRSVEYYLHHEKEREAIAESGYQEVIARHTYRHRMRELLDLASARLKIPSLAAFK